MDLAARRFHMEVQPQLILLQKTLLNIEGLGRQLYPELDLWQTAKPFLERWMGEQLGPRALMRELKTHAPRWAETLPAMPGLAYEVLRQARSGKLRVELAPAELEKIRREIRRSHQRTVLGVAGTGLIVAAVVLLAAQGGDPARADAVPLLTWILGGIGAYMIVAALPWDSD